MITNEMAWRLRSERQLQLPTDANFEYETPRVREIAERQAEIMKEFEALDVELLSLCKLGLKPLEDIARHIRP